MKIQHLIPILFLGNTRVTSRADDGFLRQDAKKHIHMKHSILIAFTSLLFVFECEAVIFESVPLPFDDIDAKCAIATNSVTEKQIEADSKQFYAVEKQLIKLPESRLKALFGAPQDTIPDGYALPVCHASNIAFSGLEYSGGFKTYFIPISDLGGIWVFPRGIQDDVSSVTLYLKTDSGFTALRSSADYLARRAWDLQHTEVIRKYIQEVLSKYVKSLVASVPQDANGRQAMLKMSSLLDKAGISYEVFKQTVRGQPSWIFKVNLDGQYNTTDKAVKILEEDLELQKYGITFRPDLNLDPIELPAASAQTNGTPGNTNTPPLLTTNQAESLAIRLANEKYIETYEAKVTDKYLEFNTNAPVATNETETGTIIETRFESGHWTINLKSSGNMVAKVLLSPDGSKNGVSVSPLKTYIRAP